MLDELYSRKTSHRTIFSWQTQFAGAAHGILPCRPALKPSFREATRRLLQRVEWRSRDRRMLDELLDFSTFWGMRCRRSWKEKNTLRGDICRPGVLGELTAAAVPEPARAPLSPTSDNVSYVRFRSCSFPACFPQRNGPSPLLQMLDMAADGVVTASHINAPAAVIGRRPDSVAAVIAVERRAAGRMAGERASVMRPAAQIVAAM
jgi:hypothetical protein